MCEVWGSWATTSKPTMTPRPLSEKARKYLKLGAAASVGTDCAVLKRIGELMPARVMVKGAGRRGGDTYRWKRREAAKENYRRRGRPQCMDLAEAREARDAKRIIGFVGEGDVLAAFNEKVFGPAGAGVFSDKAAAASYRSQHFAKRGGRG